MSCGPSRSLAKSSRSPSDRAKGDQDPSSWWPEEAGYRCTYAKMWVATKHRWELSLQSEEKAALTEELASC